MPVARGRVRRPVHLVASMAASSRTRSRNSRGQGVGRLVSLPCGPIAALPVTPASVPASPSLPDQSSAESSSKDLNWLRHELRTPLTGLLGLAELLATLNLPGQASNWLATLQACGQQLASLIDRTLLPVPDDAAATWKQANTDGLRLLETLLVSHWPAAQEAGIKLLLVFQPQARGFWQIDEVWLRQALDNLLSNAIRFTRSGHVTLEARAIPQFEAEHDQLELVVEDCGPGLSGNASNLQDGQEYADRTYRMFRRGCGLQVVEEVCQRYGGQLQRSLSTLGGAKFVLRLPGVVARRGTHSLPFSPALQQRLHCLLWLDTPQRQALSAMLGCMDTAFENISGLDALGLAEWPRSQVLICRAGRLSNFLATDGHLNSDALCLLSLKPTVEGSEFYLQILSEPLMLADLQTALLRCLVLQGPAAHSTQALVE